MEEKQAFELMRLVSSPHWPHFVAYIEAKQKEAVNEMLNMHGEDVHRSLGKLKVYRDMMDFHTTVMAKNEEYKNG